MTRRSTVAQYNWDKCEFDETILPASPARSSARTEKIQFVVVHHMTIKGDGSGSALTACSNTWKTREASAHYGVDGNLVRQFVWDNRAAWATANHHGNHAGLSIEHANSALSPKWTVADTTWKTGAKLVAHLHSQYKLGRPVSGKTLRRHHDFYATSCPGPYVDSIWSKYVAEAQRVYDEITAKPPVVTPPKPPAKPANTLTILTNNLWGYGTSPSSSTQAARLPQFVAMVKAYKPDLIALQELSNQGSDKRVQHGDTVAKTPFRYVMDNLHDLGYAYDSIGSDGRYIFRRTSVVDFIKGKTLHLTPEYKGDNKQSACGVYRKGDRIFSLTSTHTENEGSDDRYRVGQTQSAFHQTYEFAKPLGVDTRWQFHAGDFNDHDNVLAAFKALGFVDSFTRAPLAQRIKAAVQSFGTYLKVYDGKRIDLVCVYKDVTVLRAEQITKYADSDHHPQIVTIQL